MLKVEGVESGRCCFFFEMKISIKSRTVWTRITQHWFLVGRSAVRIRRWQIIFLFLSHRFNSLMPDFLLSEDLAETILEGWHHEFNPWEKGKSKPQGLYTFYLYNVCSIIAEIDWIHKRDHRKMVKKNLIWAMAVISFKQKLAYAIK